MVKAKENGVKIHLPVDFICATFQMVIRGAGVCAAAFGRCGEGLPEEVDLLALDGVATVYGRAGD